MKKQIVDYVKHHDSEYDITENKHYKALLTKQFVTLCKDISSKSENKTFPNFFYEWDCIHICGETCGIPYNECDSGYSPSRCSCDKENIIYNSVIRNKHNNNEVIIGSKCIQKILLIKTSNIINNKYSKIFDRMEEVKKKILKYKREVKKAKEKKELYMNSKKIKLQTTGYVWNKRDDIYTFQLRDNVRRIAEYNMIKKLIPKISLYKSNKDKWYIEAFVNKATKQKILNQLFNDNGIANFNINVSKSGNVYLTYELKSKLKKKA